MTAAPNGFGRIVVDCTADGEIVGIEGIAADMAVARVPGTVVAVVVAVERRAVVD